MDRIQLDEHGQIKHMLQSLIHRGTGRVSTFSIVVGTSACDADCKHCVSHMTGLLESDPIHFHKFDKAALLAKSRMATTVLLTGKGEPMLYPEQITLYLQRLQNFAFPIIELQTNGILIGQAVEQDQGKSFLYDQYLRDWYDLGLNTIALSLSDVDEEENKKTFLHHRPNVNYPDLAQTVRYLHNMGYSIRFCIMLQKGVVDSPQRLEKVIRWCKDHDVEQCTVRPLRVPENPKDPSYAEYTRNVTLTPEQLDCLEAWVFDNGTPLLTLSHGNHASIVYDIFGQNLCWADCLTVDSNTDDIRTLIYFGQGRGRIAYDWQYEGAVIM